MQQDLNGIKHMRFKKNFKLVSKQQSYLDGINDFRHPGERDDGPQEHKSELDSTMIHQDITMIWEQVLCSLPSLS